MLTTFESPHSRSPAQNAESHSPQTRGPEAQREGEVFFPDAEGRWLARRVPNALTPLTRRMPAASSGLSRPESAASYANRLTAASR